MRSTGVCFIFFFFGLFQVNFSQQNRGIDFNVDLREFVCCIYWCKAPNVWVYFQNTDEQMRQHFKWHTVIAVLSHYFVVWIQFEHVSMFMIEMIWRQANLWLDQLYSNKWQCFDAFASVGCYCTLFTFRVCLCLVRLWTGSGTNCFRNSSAVV